MSLSNLGSQLAALNNSNNNNNLHAGSNLPSSRRHDDAIGRGLHHSVQLGHSSAMYNSHKFKASILHETARNAADIPVTTLRENARDALMSLQEEYGLSIKSTVFFQLFGGNGRNSSGSVLLERGQQTKAENEVLDDTIQDLLFALGPYLGGGSGDGTNKHRSCLYILEYLLRQFDLHVRPQLASTWLLVSLPHHEESVYFGRLLQLIDLASIPTYAFMRPYAIPNAIVGRSLFAQQVAANDKQQHHSIALLRELCRLAQRTGTATASGGKEEEDSKSRTLAFVAAVLVEAMARQQQRLGSVTEQTVQVLLPYIIKACQSGNDSNTKKKDVSVEDSYVWMNWGHVLASTLVEYGTLALETKRVLALSVLQGLNKKKNSADVSAKKATSSLMDPDIRDNGLIVAFTLLAQPGHSSSELELLTRKEHKSFPSNYSFSKSRNTGETTVFVDAHILRALWKLPNVASALHRLCHEPDMKDRMIHWIVSILAVGSHLVIVNQVEAKKNEKHSRLQLLLEEILQDSRFEGTTLWSSENIEDFVAFLLQHCYEESVRVKHKEMVFAMLNGLKKRNATAHDKGITKAIVRGKSREKRKELAQWLGLVDNLAGSEKDPSKQADDIVLPPRVALEHGDEKVRLYAISRLLEEEPNLEEPQVGDESLHSALVRRLRMESNATVAIASAKALNQILERSKHSISHHFAEECLEATYGWINRPSLSQEDQSTLTIQLIVLLSHTSVLLRQVTFQDQIRVATFEVLISFLRYSSSTIQKEASKAIQLGLTGKISRKDGVQLAQEKLLLEPELLEQLRRPLGASSTDGQTVRKKIVPTLLEAFEQNPATSPVEAFHYAVWAVQSCSEKVSQEEEGWISSCLEENSKKLSPDQSTGVVEVLISLQPNTFRAVALVAAKNVLVLCNEDSDSNAIGGIAVVFDIALSDSSPSEIQNVLELVKTFIETKPVNSHEVFAPALALLTHDHAGVRDAALDTLASVKVAISRQTSGEWSLLTEVCEYVLKNRSSAAMGGRSFICACLEFIGKSKKTNKMQNCFLQSVCLPFATQQRMQRLPVGAMAVATVILQAAEAMENPALGLSNRWQYCAKPILVTLMECEENTELTGSTHELLVTLLKVLGGLQDTGNAALDTIITSGPTRRGGRSRSYSFGKKDGPQFLNPYPKEMSDHILLVLRAEGATTAVRAMRNILCDLVLRSEPWGNQVFCKLTKAVRLDIGESVLNCVIQNLSDNAEDTFFSLQFEAEDVTSLLQRCLARAESSVAISYISDYSSSQASRLSSCRHCDGLYVALFSVLRSLQRDEDSADDSAYTFHSILNGIDNLTTTGLCASFGSKARSHLLEWVNLLIQIVGRSASKGAHTVQAIRNQRLASSVLTSLCNSFPEQIVGELVPAVSGIISNIREDDSMTTTVDCLVPLVASFLDHSSHASKTPVELILPFLKECKKAKSQNLRFELYRGFTEAIQKSQTSDDGLIAPCGAFIAGCVSNESDTDSWSDDCVAKFISQSMRNSLPQEQLAICSSLLVYVKELLATLGEEDEQRVVALLSTADLLSLTTSTTQEGRTESSSTQMLCSALFTLVAESLSSHSLKKFVRRIERESSATVLRIWQDLMIVQSGSMRISVESSTMLLPLRSIAELANEMLEELQNILPTHIFLALATHLIQDGESDALRSRALQMIADRSTDLDATDPESSLYKDLLPFLTELLSPLNGRVTRQAALVTIESISKSVFASPTVNSTDQHHLKTSLNAVADILTQETASDDFKTQEATREVLASAALCAATVIRMSGARALSFLPKIVPPLIRCLQFANASFDNEDPIDQAKDSLLQLSAVRSMCSIVETLPQFLGPYMASLLAEGVLPSKQLMRDDDDRAILVKGTTERLFKALSKSVQPRQLIPPIAQSIGNCTSGADSIGLLALATSCVQNAKTSSLSGLVGALLNIATCAYDIQPDDGIEEQFTLAGHDLLLALVLKLSEIQLRSLYARLLQWRGEFNAELINEGARRRRAFWDFSSRLAQLLKPIFLPCLTSVFSEAIDELVAVVESCTSTGKVKKSGNKRQRLSDRDAKLSNDAMASTQSLLLCIEHALRADAHAGGGWVREGDFQRFNLLLDPMQCLLVNSIPGEKGVSAMVHTDQGDMGTVVNSLVALALAAGDEKLWKPLNHSVLDACGKDDRADTKKAGVSCLLSLIRNIGEEYMVLIPECLPVLSERLEDSDEEIAGIAQDCITMSEDLLGESLHDSLR